MEASRERDAKKESSIERKRGAATKLQICLHI